MKRLCLFAGYNKTGSFADYVLYYVTKMSEFADVRYFCDCELKEEDKNKLLKFAKSANGYRHEEYDFGSWKILYKAIPKDELEQYDELILCNDSCFGPIYDLKPLMDRASKDNECDFWGFNAHSDETFAHISSYFVVLKKKVFISHAFVNHLMSVKKEACLNDVINNYEKKLTHCLMQAGFKPKVLFNDDDNSIYLNWKKAIQQYKFPFIKVKVFTNYFVRVSSKCYNNYGWLTKKYDYPISLIADFVNYFKIKYKIRYYARFHLWTDAIIFEIFKKTLFNIEFREGKERKEQNSINHLETLNLA